MDILLTRRAEGHLVLGLMLIVATPRTHRISISLKCWVVFFSYMPDYICTLFSPHYILITLTFLDWFSARTSAKLPITCA